MSLGRQVFSSAFLLFLRKVWGNVINLIVMAFLARLLSKADFGLLAISSVFLSIINTVATSGISEYVVYYRGEDELQKVNAAFWLNLILTIAVIVIVIVAGPFWADFYKDERVYTLLLVLLVSFFFEMGSTVPKAMLRKELEYKSLVYYSGVAMAFVSAGKLIGAFSGLGVYSLALPQAIVSPFLMLSFFCKTKWRPSSQLDVIHFPSIFKYSKHIIGGRVLTKLVNEGDNLIVGKFVGLEGLGLYSLAFQLANLVTTNVVLLVNDLFLPLFSKVRGEINRLRDVYLKMIRFLSFLSFPLISILAIAAEPIVFFFYGEKWLDAVLPLQILCTFALARSISSPSSSLFNALGKPEIGFKFTLYFTPIFLLSVYVGSKFGVVGVATATSIVRVLGSLVSLYLSLGLLKLTIKDLFLLIRNNFVSMLFILLIFFLLLTRLIDGSRIILILILPVLAYLYFLFQRLLFRPSLVTTLSEVGKYMRPGGMKLVQKALFMSSQNKGD